ncbi:MAG: isoleucine--tRNA ligase [Patescibacteria group bacterium]|nr:isoleucine--tRNA ligase [Patescibacteria group bacterium]
MFKPVDPKVNFPQLEEKILGSWQKEKIFEKSLERRKPGQKFTFYDGPPFATGLPHYGHILAMTIKDAVTRLKTMQGYYVPRRLGWDCHGLPVEYEVEKEIGSTGKRDIEAMGIGKFNETCRSIVFRYTEEWKKTISRMGRWVDQRNSYATMDQPYMESIWWVFKQLWDKEMIYQGFRSMPYCPRCGTPLSNFETNLGYRDNTQDPSVFIKFELVKEPGTFLLAWTTTPWTLPGNEALAIGKDMEYVKVKVNEQFLILAKDRLEVLDVYELVGAVKGEDLIGQEYKPLLDFFLNDREGCLKDGSAPSYILNPENLKNQIYKVYAADFVSTLEGTGIVHIAPAFGEDDLKLGQKEKMPIIQHVDDRGLLVLEPWKGIFAKNADPMITEYLDQADSLYKSGTYSHTYPFCWRCDTPLLYYAISNWFVQVSEIRDQLVENNKKIHWMPKHIKEGRFGKWLEEARDWSISRNRFWGTPLPLWYCEKCKKYECVGSIEELKEKAVNLDEVYQSKEIDLHRPYIDELRLKCSCGGESKRIPEVLDCWFESGSMPYAQDHYPFEGKEEFEKNFPANFIAEGLDQTRGWFYTLHVLSSILSPEIVGKAEPAFKNCIVNGIILDKEGKKLSKRLRNYPEPDEVFDKYGADAMRFLLLSSPATLAEDVRFSAEAVEETVRKVFLILWNVYSFFVTYANMDGLEGEDKGQANRHGLGVLDRWILSELNQLVEKSERAANDYNLPGATRPIGDFINDLSTWYIRRSRDRVGPTATDTDTKNDFYFTLKTVLVTLAKLMAPYAPFIVEEIYQNLTGEQSVHLSDYPKVEEKLVDKKLSMQMRLVREIVEMGHAKRKEVQIKVRQPLAKVTVKNVEETFEAGLTDLVKDELNVKDIEVIVGKGTLEVGLDTRITSELKAEGEARDLIRAIQEKRKEAGVKMDDWVIVSAPSWPKEFEDYIKKETLAKELCLAEELKVEKLP